MAFDLFWDIFSYRESGWSRIDPRIKLVTAMGAVLFVLFSTRIVLPLILFGCCVAITLMLRVPVRLLLLRLAFPAGMAVLLIFLMAITQGERSLWSVSFLGRHLSIREEGLFRGILMSCRVLGAVSTVLLLSTVTPAHKIIAALHSFRVSSGWKEIAMLMYRYIFCLLDRAADTSEAQRVRLGYLNIRKTLNSLGGLAGSVVLGSLDQAQNTHDAMLVRGYSGTIPFSPLSRLNGKDISIGLAILLGLGTIYLLMEWC